MCTSTDGEKCILEKYKLIMSYIEKEIRDNKLKEGERIPSLRAIANMFECNKITVIKAYECLKEKNIIYSMPKSGYYVLKNLSSDNDDAKEKIDFTSVSPDESMLPYEDFQKCISNAMETYKNELFNTSFPKGLPQLINTIHVEMQEDQIFADEKKIFITSGSQQIINILVQMPFDNDGDTILIEQPTYHGIINVIKMNNAKVLTIDRSDEDLDINKLEEILKTNKIKFFYTMSRYHNPTAYSFSSRQKKIILELLNKYNTYLVEDDYLGDFEVKKNSYPMYSMDMNDRVIYLKSYSKIIMPGLRIAAVVLPDPLIETFAIHKQWNDLNTSIVSQGALQIYIKSGMLKEHTKIMRKIFKDKMNKLKMITNENQCRDIVWNIPEGGFVASFKINKDKYFGNMIEDLSIKNIFIDNTKRYYLKPCINDRFIRVSLSRVSDNQMDFGIRKIIETIKNK